MTTPPRPDRVREPRERGCETREEEPVVPSIPYDPGGGSGLKTTRGAGRSFRFAGRVVPDVGLMGGFDVAGSDGSVSSLGLGRGFFGAVAASARPPGLGDTDVMTIGASGGCGF